MALTIAEIRKQFPMYDDLSDEDLVLGVRKKFYPDIPLKDFLSKVEFKGSDPTVGMSTTDKFLAGAGKAYADLGRGIGQYFGAVDRQDVADARKRDAALMNTTAGKVGDVVGNVALTAPTALIPGAATYRGAAAIGALTGALQPSESTSETVYNTLGGGALGAGAQLAGRAVGAGYRGLTGLLRPFYDGGRQRIAAEVLQSAADDPAAAAVRAAAARPLIPGSNPTLGQVADDAGLAQLERSLINNPDTAGPINLAYEAQREARRQALERLAGAPATATTKSARDVLAAARSAAAKADYDAAMAAGVDPAAAAAIQPKIDSLLRRPTMKDAIEQARILAADNDMVLDNIGSVQGLDWVKKALDNEISKLRSGQPTAIKSASLGTLTKMKSDLMEVLEEVAPLYKKANDNFAAASKPINAMDVAGDLQKRLYKDLQWGSTGRETGADFRRALGKAFESVKSSTGMDVPIERVMPKADVDTLNAVAQDLLRKEAAQNLGRAPGSNTLQNILSQNLLERISGPLGIPQSFAQSVAAQTIMRPYDWVMRAAQPRVAGLLSDAIVDPALGARFLTQAGPARMDAIGRELSRYLPMTGLLAVEDR